MVEAPFWPPEPSQLFRRLGGVAELRGGHVVDGSAELRVVEDVEKSALDFSEKHSLNLNILSKVKVNLRRAEARRALRPRAPCEQSPLTR